MKYALPILLLLVSLSCSNSSTEPPSPPPGMTANPSSVHLLPGGNQTVSIVGSTRPDVILINTNAVVATATLSDTVVNIHGVTVGSTSVRIGDGSSSQKTVDISITVATAAAAVVIGE